MYFLFLINFILVVAAVFLVWKSYLYGRKILFLKKIQKMPFPSKYEIVLNKIPHYTLLPESLKRKMQKSILFFIETKEFRGVEIMINDEIKIVIAFYACLLKLYKNDCYEELHTIIVYPDDVISESVRNEGGISKKETMILEGQSIGSTVVIAWNEAKKEAYHPKRHNVIIHEFAHVQDFESGDINGVPLMEYSKYRHWTQILFKEYDKLKEVFLRGRYLQKYKFIGDYAATDEAEFFAVVSELFFEKPLILKKHFPDIYNELKEFYGLDTATIFTKI